jgi:dynein assembly factor 5
LRAAVLVEASILEEDACIDILRRLVYDKANAVREGLYVSLGEWLLNLRDRYGFAPKLLPLFLSGLSDEMPKIQEITKCYLERLGKMYEYDYEDRVKDEVDYTTEEQRIGTIARDRLELLVSCSPVCIRPAAGGE